MYHESKVRETERTNGGGEDVQYATHTCMKMSFCDVVCYAINGCDKHKIN